MADFYIRIGQTFDVASQTTFDPTTYTLCHYQSTALGGGETRIFECDDPLVGRYVTVHFPQSRSERLTLREVTVFEFTGTCIRGKIQVHYDVTNITFINIFYIMVIQFVRIY